jgi:hypothetical protein
LYAKGIDYKSSVEVSGSQEANVDYEEDKKDEDIVHGWVFKDKNRNGTMDRKEKGIIRCHGL